MQLMIMTTESLVERASLSRCRRNEGTEVTHPGLFLSLLLLTERTPTHQEKQEAGYQIRQNNSSTVLSDWQEAQPLLCPRASGLDRNSQPQGSAGHAAGSLGWALWLVLSNQPPGHPGQPARSLGSGEHGAEKGPMFTGHPLSNCLFMMPVPYLEGGSWFPWRKWKQWGSESLTDPLSQGIMGGDWNLALSTFKSP